MPNIEVKFPDVSIPPKTLEFVQRILGPLAEAGDFLSEKIRFYRWRSSLKTVKRAQEIAAQYGVTPQEVPLKTFVPLLERASLEEEDSPLIEKWATLLAQASADPLSVHAVYVEILSRLNADDVRTLETVLSKSVIDAATERTKISDSLRRAVIYIAATGDGMYKSIEDEINQLCKDREKKEYHEDLKTKIFVIKRMTKPFYVESVTISFYRYEEDDLFSYSNEFPSIQSLDVLSASGLIVRRPFRSNIGDAEATVTIVLPTVLGLQFVMACRGDHLKQDGLKAAQEQ